MSWTHTASTPMFSEPLSTPAHSAATSSEPPAPQLIERPVTQVRPLSCEKLTDVPGKSVTTALVTFPPGAYSPAHRHPGSVTAFVVSGSIRSQLAGTPPQVYAAGSTWFEPTGTLHVFAENSSAIDTAVLLAVFVADEDCGALVLPEPQTGPNGTPDGQPGGAALRR